MQGKQQAHNTPDTPHTYLLLESDSSDKETVQRLPVDDQGSQPSGAHVNVQGVPIYGIVDSGADITIIGGDMFKKAATVARLWKRNLQPVDRTPYDYELKPFKLEDGRMDLEISFGEKTMMTPVYIKMNAKDPLLLSEGVCHQLGIIRVRLVGGVSVCPTHTTLTHPEDYREELVVSLSSARELAVKSIQSPQYRYSEELWPQ